MAQVAGEEGHLVDADDDDPLGGRERRDASFDLLAGEGAGRLLEVGVIRGQRRLEFGVVE